MSSRHSIGIVVGAIALGCTGCASSSGGLDGKYVGPGAELKLSGSHYFFCQNKETCSTGRLEVRPLASGSGRVAFYGQHISDYVHSKGGPRSKEGVELAYVVGPFGRSYIYIDRRSDVRFSKGS